MPIADAVVGTLLSDWHPRRVLPHFLVAGSVAVLTYPALRFALENLVVSTVIIVVGLLAWFGSESQAKAELNESLRKVLSSFDFDVLLSLIFDVLERERSFFSDIFESESWKRLFRFAGILALRSVGFYLVLFSIVISANDLAYDATKTDYLLAASSIGGQLVLFMLVIAVALVALSSRLEVSEPDPQPSNKLNPLARDVIRMYLYGNFRKLLEGVTNVMRDVASLLTFPMMGKNPFVFDSMQEFYFPNGLLDAFSEEVKAGRLVVKDQSEYEQLRMTDVKGVGLTELLKLTQNEILKLSFSSKPDPSLSKYRANRCRFAFPSNGGSVIVSAFKACLSSVERDKRFRGVRQKRSVAFWVFAVGDKKPVSDLKLKLELNAKKITSELAPCEGP